MPLDDKIRFHKLVIMKVDELNYPILKIDMIITHWKSIKNVTPKHKPTMSKNPSTKDS
jgi:hypothetical protein